MVRRAQGRSFDKLLDELNGSIEDSFGIGDSELTADLAGQEIRYFRVAGNRGRATRVGEIDIPTVFRSLSNQHAAKPFEVANQLSPLHSHLDLFYNDFALRESRNIHRLLDHPNRVDEVLSRLLQRRSLGEGP